VAEGRQRGWQEALKQLWVEQGDVLSLQYAGSQVRAPAPAAEPSRTAPWRAPVTSLVTSLMTGVVSARRRRYRRT